MTGSAMSLVEPLLPDTSSTAERVQQWAAASLPVPPSWRVYREAVLATDATELAGALSTAAGSLSGTRYWVLHQGPATPGSQRESLANLDSDQALAAALLQLFRREQAPAQVIIQSLPARRAAGVLFTRHPVRQDLEHVVVEGVVEQGGAATARLILHRNGTIAFSSGDERLETHIDAGVFTTLASQLRNHFERPQACEWIFDGEKLWMVQALPIGSLPHPKEAWSRRAGQGLWQQAVSPLWYTLAGRWLKTAFWRPLGERLGWQDLANIEPYRRQHSHIYSNSQFFLRLLDAGVPTALHGVPPAWRPVTPVKEQRYLRARDGLRPWLTPMRLKRLGRLLTSLDTAQPGPGDLEGLWRHLMRLDRLGERLAAIEGWLSYCQPGMSAADDEPADELARRLPREHWQALKAAGEGGALPAGAALGADPVFTRFGEHPAELALLGSLPGERAARLCQLPRPVSLPRAEAAALRERLGGSLRRLLLSMGRVLVARGRLVRDEDIFFVYFDELWHLWQAQGSGRPGPETLASRKMRLLTDAHQGAPDWMIDQIAYGARLDQREHPALNGQAVVASAVTGPTRVLHTGWALSQIQPGEILVLDQYETGWLPWLCLAGGLVLAGHDPDQPAALLARWLGIPCIVGVDDAMHCLVSGGLLALNEPAGAINRPTT